MRRLGSAVLSAALAAACGGEAVAPADLDTRHDTCASCRMTVSVRRLASQIAAPGEEPLFFDDLGCLRDYVKTHGLPRGAIAFVADHRTGEWTRAAGAVFSQLAPSTTPMGSGFIAHASAASRAADPLAEKSRLVRAQDLFEAAIGSPP